MKDNRSKRALIAQETLEILENGEYEVSGITVSIQDKMNECLENTKLYLPESFDEIRLPHHLFETKFEVSNETSLAAARRLSGEQNGSVAVLNFASAKNPGGGFLGGSQAQEESIARSSGLYSTLVTQPHYYEINRECKTAFYTEHMIYSPRTPVFRDDANRLLIEPYVINIITSPAINRGALIQQKSDRLAEVDTVMRNRIANVLKVALENGNTKIVLGAWGCGVFKNSADNIATLFKDAFENEFIGLFEHVIFAVFDKSERLDTYNAFESKFGKRNDVSLSEDFSGALRTFAYFMASGTHYMLKDVDYLSLNGTEPSAIEQVFAIFANVIKLDSDGSVLNFKSAQKRATDYLREYCNGEKVEPPYEDWETALHWPPPLEDRK